MTEDFLHYLWKFQKINATSLKTTNNEVVQVLKTGEHNTDNSGPDFFNSQIIINQQKWAGTVEIHLKSSDWYAHKHQTDTAYDNVILHVVWEHDVDVFSSNNSPIPTLELKHYVNPESLKKYNRLLKATSKWINCENQLESISDFTWNNWLERLYFERLNTKSERVATTFLNLNKHWEATCFSLIAQYFGGNVNGNHFLKIAKSIPFNVIQKTTSAFQLEALFFGQANLLNNTLDDTYYIELLKEYKYLQHKYQLKPNMGLQLQFFRLRPPNFPTIRLAQLAMLYSQKHQLFSILNSENNPEKIKSLLKTSTSEYWQTHYNFGKESKKSVKRLTDSFIEVLIINAILPLRFLYSKTVSQGSEDDLLTIITSLKEEKNSIVTNFKKNNLPIKNAMHSQATIQLKKEYCDVNRCLKCAVGFELLKSPIN